MRKSVLMIMLITCACIRMQAQVNYVLNGSLEQYNSCPLHDDQIRFANFWNAIDTIDAYPNCAPEYYNTCAGTGGCQVPLNAAGYQYPRSGKAYAGGKMFFDERYVSNSIRDYTQGKLFDHLTSGKSYCVTFYVSLAEVSGYAVNKIGAYLDNGEIDTAKSTCSIPQTGYVPQIIETLVINDTANWVKVSGSFTANGSERFITIGNFYSKANTSYTNLPYSTSPIGYYFVDDISVIESTERANAGPDVAIVPGDSVHIGSYDEGMPCDWYRLGSSTVLTHNGGLWVKPDSSTSYVVELDLCGVVTKDTVRVVVDRTGIPLTPKGGPSIWPNPASQQLTIEHAAGMGVDIYDVVGKGVFNTLIKSDKDVIDISSLPKGVYVVCVSPTPTLPQGEGDVTQRRFMRLVKE